MKLCIQFALLAALVPVAAYAQEGHGMHPNGTPPTWTVDTSAIGPAQLTGHGSFSPATQTVTQPNTATVTISPDPGYVLAGVEGDGCSPTDNGDGTWTTDEIYGNCTIVATFALSPAEVVFQGDFDPDLVTFANVNLDLPPTILGASINWQTGATCTGTNDAPCDNTYHFRPASSFPVMGHYSLVFRYPTSIADDTYGIVTDVAGDDGNSVPLQSGATIGADSTFGFPVSAASSAAWVSADGVDGYVGFRFLNSNTGLVNYGYAHLVTGATQPGFGVTGFPATIVDFSYDRRGAAVTIP